MTEDLAASITRLEEALEQARLAGESAERRLRLQRDQVDDELAAALSACRRLEEEKLAALGLDRVRDAEVFQAEPSSPASALTLIGLREEWASAHRAAMTELQVAHQERLEAQAHELSQRYFQELQDIAVKNAKAMQHQAEHYQARADEEARRRAHEQAVLASNHASGLDSVRQELSARLVDEAALRQQIAALTSELHVIHAETAAAHRRIHELLSSTSWRAARPLRGVGRVLRWLSRK
ncbi:hypothetical protein [Lichenifustis flavocetrariae]|uniref:Uncharacterized protein n=1 Tax=Lichenifustis flavocetrariae TaxID=2949735 RepID=A0AA41Z226_9HYPH|nr:hypothetical protein [Lichenifustis flavocetrariae]MCW6511428.1 hypothetical protein [Lichenifustis flavocetrariae]